MTSEYLNDPFEDSKPEPPACPVCGRAMVVRSWQEERGTVETDTRCPAPNCYSCNWSYGRTEVTIGEKEWGWSHSTPGAETTRIEAEIEAETQRLTAERTTAKA